MCQIIPSGSTRRQIALAAVFIAASILFLTRSARGQTQILSESFDTAVVPALPAGWTTSGSGWATSTSSASTGSGLQNLAHTGASSGFALTVPVDLSTYSSASLSYLARRTSSYPADSLRVTASIDSGATFPLSVLAFGTALPVASSSYNSISGALPAGAIGQTSVILRFEAFGGSTGGSNIRLDDVAVTGTPLPPGGGGGSGGGGSGGGSGGSGGTGSNTVGIGSVNPSVLESSTGYILPLDLTMASPDSLHGLQVTVSWDNALASLSAVTPGAAVSDTTAWGLNWNVAAGSVQIVLLSRLLTGLPPGAYSGIVDLSFDLGALPAPTADSVHVSLSNALGSLADALGTDAGLTISSSAAAIAILPREAHLSTPSLSLDVGSVATGSTVTGTISVSNVTATRSLVVSGAATSSTLFTVAPGSFTLAPDSSLVLSVSFSPTDTAFGIQTALLTLTHDGTSGPTTVWNLTGIGTGGRGDADGDGMVELLDVVTGIDGVIGRAALSATETTALDTFPFPAGDGAIDVRDLTVLVQSVVRGAWPDLVTLPVEQPPASPAQIATGKQAIALLQFSSSDTHSFDISLETDVPLRGFELILEDVSGGDLPSTPSLSERALGSATTFLNADTGVMRLLLAPGSGDMIVPGRYVLGRVETRGDGFEPSVVYATALGEDRERIPIQSSVVTVATERTIEPGGGWTLGPPYPNPLRLSTYTSVSIPIHRAGNPVPGKRVASDSYPAPPSLRVELFDLLGRRIPVLPEFVRAEPDRVVLSTRPLEVFLTSGTYIIRVSSGSVGKSRVSGDAAPGPGVPTHTQLLTVIR